MISHADFINLEGQRFPGKLTGSYKFKVVSLGKIAEIMDAHSLRLQERRQGKQVASFPSAGPRRAPDS